MNLTKSGDMLPYERREKILKLITEDGSARVVIPDTDDHKCQSREILIYRCLEYGISQYVRTVRQREACCTTKGIKGEQTQSLLYRLWKD